MRRFDEKVGHWFSYRVADGVRTNLTDKITVRFQQENDTPDLPGVQASPAGRLMTVPFCSTTSSTSGK